MNSNSVLRLPPARLAWLVWGIGACLYLIGFFQRVAPAVITGELMRDFAIGAAALGNLSALYFYSYVAMQIPTGMLCDAWGPRRLLTTGAAVAAFGSVLFVSAGGVVGSALTFAGLWGVPFLTTHYRLAPATAAAVCSGMLVAWAVAGPIFGALSDHIGRRKPLYVGGCSVVLAGWSLLLLGPRLPLPALWAVILVIGFASGAMVLSFAYAKESVSPAIAGTATGVVNMGAMLGPMLLQPLVGWMLDRGWDGALEGGARVYPLAAYHAGFTLMIGWAALSLVAISLTRETFARAPGKMGTDPG